MITSIGFKANLYGQSDISVGYHSGLNSVLAAAVVN